MSVLHYNFKSLVNKPGFLVFICMLLAVLYFQSAFAKEKPQLMLLKTYQPGLVVSGWVMSEKLDGVSDFYVTLYLLLHGSFSDESECVVHYLLLSILYYVV